MMSTGVIVAIVLLSLCLVHNIVHLNEYWLRIPLYRLTTRPLPLYDRTRHYMRWYQVFPGGVPDDADEAYYERRGKDMFNLMYLSEDKTGFPVPDNVTLIIHYDHASKTKSLYIGAPYDNYSMMQWARTQSTTVKEVSLEDVPLPQYVSKNNIAVANTTTSHLQALKSVTTKNDIGAVCSYLFDPDTMRGDATAILGLKRMSKPENERFQAYLSAEEKHDADDNPFIDPTASRKINAFANNKTSRGVLCIVSDEERNGGKKTTALIDSLQTRFSSLPFNYEGQSLSMNLGRDLFFHSTLVVSIIAAIILAIGIARGNMLLVGLSGGALGLFILNEVLAFATPMFSTAPFAHTIKRGYIAQPGFHRLSPRFIMKKMASRNSKGRVSSWMLGHVMNPRPTHQHILPLYFVPLTQFFTFPSSTQLDTFAQSDAPMVGYPVPQENIFDHMRDKILLGISITGQPVYRDLSLLESGMTFAGGTNTGKTNAMINYYVGVARKCYGNSRGAHITPIWLNTKEKNANDIKAAMEPIFGNPFTSPYKYVCIDTENPHLPFRLSLEGRTVVNPTQMTSDGRFVKGKKFYSDDVSFDDLQSNIDNMTAAVNAIFGSAIRDESKMWLSNIVTIAMLLQPWEIANMSKGDPTSPLSLAHFVGCSKSDVHGQIVQQPNFMNLCLAIAGGWESFDPITAFSDLQKEWSRGFADYTMGGSDPRWEAERRERLSQAMVKFISPTKHANKNAALEKTRPILNKFHGLTKFAAMWDNYTPDGRFRKPLFMKQLIHIHKPVIINFSGYEDADGTIHDSGSDLIKEQYTVLVHEAMWETMKQSLVDGAGNFYPIFCDEITNLSPMLDDSGARGNVTRMLEDIKDKGRSKGVTHILGFQNFTQLSKIGVFDSLVGVESSLIFRLPQSTPHLEEQLKQDGQSIQFSSHTLRSLPRGTAMTALKLSPSGHERTPFFTMRTPYQKDYAKAVAALAKKYGSLDFPEENLYRVLLRRMRKQGLVTQKETED